MATFANIVSENVEGLNIEVAAGGAATLHQLEVAKGNLDMAMTSTIIHVLMTNQRAMYQDLGPRRRSGDQVPWPIP